MENFHVSQRIKVLLVDDDAMGRQVVRTLLEHVGIEVVEAVNGAEAVALVRNENFDLVLMDSQMPVMDGVAATVAIRSIDNAGADVLPILAMTADVFEEHRLKYRTAGMNGIIEKPVEIENLYGQIGNFISLPQDKKEGGETTVQPADIFDLEAALPGVDVKAGLHRVLDNRQPYLVLLRKFVARHCSTEKLLLAELESGQQKEAILRVHTIKGMAGGLGATYLQQIAECLELQLIHAEAPTAMNDMLRALSHLLAAIESLPTDVAAEDDSLNKLPGSAEQLAIQLRLLIEPLQNLQVQAINGCMATIKQTEYDEEYHGDLQQLQLLIEQYQYPLAVKLLESLLARLQ